MTDPRILGTANLAIAAVKKLTDSVDGLAAASRQLYADNENLRTTAAEGEHHAADRVRLRRQLRLVSSKLGSLLARNEFEGNPQVREVLFNLDVQINTTLDRSYDDKGEPNES